MKRLLTLLLFFFSLGLQVTAQQTPELTRLVLKDDLAKKYSFQFSSIVITNDSIILVTEKCSKIYILNKETLDVISVKEDLPNDQIGSIEGVTLYKGRYLFMIDENKVAIFCYDLKGETPFKKIAGPEQFGSGNATHLEGIAINDQQSICYVLQEVDSKIFLFDIQADNTLTIKQNFREIILPTKGWKRRTDLVYDKNTFYILATNYPQTERVTYGIDIFAVDSFGTSLTGEYKMIDLSSCQDLPNPNLYSQNLEGFAKNSGYFYVISDNEESNNAYCGRCRKCRLSQLLKFRE